MAHYVYPAANAQPAPAYPAAVQTAFVAATPQAAAYATAPRAGQAYDAYQTQHTTPQYAYARTQVAVTPAATYEQKTYYQPAQAGATYTTGDTQYQQQTVVVKPSYSTGTTYAAQRQATVPKVQTVQVTSTPTNYVYTAGATSQSATTYNPATTYQSTTTATTSTYSGYDAALYSAATSYYQQQQAAKASGTWSTLKKTGTTAVGKNGLGKPKVTKQPQLHYCDVCKISCAGPQTYREHLEGQKHKKKEAAAKTGSATVTTGRGGQNQLRCELCDVTCTGADAYAAHVRGAKHQKVLKLHTKLGKPIPSTDPVVVGSTKPSTTAQVVSKPVASTTTKTTAAPATTNTVKKVLATPKITFVGGSQLKTTGVKMEEVKAVPASTPTTSSQASVDSDDLDDGPLNILGEKDVTPVGHEYIEEIKNDATGKIISFNCKLCECKFNDPNAKDMHMKGRRHRLQYKKKVDPSLQVEIKPSIRVRKIQEEKLRRQAQKEEFWRRKEQEQRMEEEYYWEERRRYQEEMEYYEWHRMGRPGMPPPRFGQLPLGIRKPDSSDDRHVMAKHASIYPNEEELQHVQNIVSACEKALKLVSDQVADCDSKSKQLVDTKEIKKESAAKPATPVKKDTKESPKKDEDGKESDKEESAPPRVLKGVMRVGVLAKGLLLHGDLNVHLVVLCSEKPTRTLLERVADGLPKQLATVTEDKYDVKRCVEEAAIVVTNNVEPKVSCTVTLTSPIMRESSEGETATVMVKDPPDVLDRHKCLDALAALRHAKWFQARANGLQSCVIVIRILRDLCQRVPTWTPLNEWAMELLVEKCVGSGGGTLNPGDALRRVFECIASGVLLPGGPGLLDPCEKDPVDAAFGLSNQEREDITASAQHALRLIAFRQIHKVLGMDALPVPRFARRPYNSRKRRRTDSAAGEGDGDGTAEKKDKKEDDAMETK
ncbi:hypothetical protein ACF0H5_013583 [Mactra antiquata]